MISFIKEIYVGAFIMINAPVLYAVLIIEESDSEEIMKFV